MSKEIEVKRSSIQSLAWEIEELGIGMLKSGFSDEVKTKDLDSTIEKLSAGIALIKSALNDKS